LQPPLATALADNALDTKLIRMGFPKYHSGVFREGTGPIAVDEDAVDERVTGPALCVCHQRVQCEQGYYVCPQCRAVLCELPVNCKICGLLLVSSPLLARSYHHLFPVVPFTPVLVRADTRTCHGCHRLLELEDSATQCGQCEHVFCLECDHFVHDSLLYVIHDRACLTDFYF
jgi:transcription initiation factor TFIIH subunit 2